MLISSLALAQDPDSYGGKAASLSRLIHAGFAIPGGFVISRAALTRFLDCHQLTAPIQSLLNDYAKTSWTDRSCRYQELCQKIFSLPIPTAFRSEIDPAAQHLLEFAPAGLAVRSSSVQEDTYQASFAGIYTSELGITSLDDLWASVRRVWCSAWSPEAAAYAAKMGLSLFPDSMAVLVQPVVAACAAGVLFTADPVTGNPWRFVLNAAVGLAPRLVDGSAPADRFVLAWDSAEILEKRVVEKPSALLVYNGQIEEVPLPPDQAVEAALEDDQVKEIAQTGLKIDQLFDRRMDIEWAVDGDQILVVQARPLTALPPFFPHQLSEEDAQETWTPYLNTWGNLNASESLVAPIAWDRKDSELWHTYLKPGDTFPRVKFKERDFNGYRYATPRQWGGGAGSSDPAYIEHWLDKNESRQRQGWLDQIERVRRANHKLDEAMQRDHDAAAWMRIFVDYAREERIMQAYVWYSPQWLGFTCEYLLKAFFAETLPDLPAEELIAGLEQGLSCYSVERTAAAQDLGRAIQELDVRSAFASLPLSEVVPALHRQHPGCHFLSDLYCFCRDYGVEPPTLEGPRPIGQDVDGILLVIKNSLLETPGDESCAAAHDARRVLAASASRRRQVEEQVRSALSERCPDQIDRFNKLLGWAQFWVPALDNRKWHTTMTVSLRWGELKRHAGEQLAAEGLVDDSQHLQMLTLDEWADFVEHPDPAALRTFYYQRLHDYEHNRRLEPLPYLGKPPETSPKQPARPEPEPSHTEPTQPKMVFQGEGISPGRVRGTARKIANMDALNYADLLTSEDILICGPASFSAEWRRDYYALFLVVRGMVAVQGAQLHHATQISRECGVPLINLPKDELDQLPEDVIIEIDGQAGTVTVLEG